MERVWNPGQSRLQHLRSRHPNRRGKPAQRGPTKFYRRNTRADLLVLANELGRPFGHHNRWQISVGAWDARHYRGVYDAQIGYSMNPARPVDDCHWIVGAADRTGADRMCHWGSSAEQFLVT